MTLRSRTIWVAILVALPWLEVALLKWFHPVQAHESTSTPEWFWWRVSILEGGAFCLIALWLIFHGLKERHVNPVLVISALAGIWFLVEWPLTAMEGILRSWHFIS